MMRSALRCCFALSLVAFASASTSQREVWHVELRGFGPVRFGMTYQEAFSALGGHLSRENGNLDSSCDYASGSGLPARTALMVVDNRIVRVDVDTDNVYTRSGAHKGSTEAEILQLYPGQIRVEPSEYTAPEGNNLIFVPRDRADSSYGLVFETYRGRVKRYRAGLYPSVGWIEGCS